MSQYIKNVLASLDRVLSAVIFNEPKFTISALCYLASIASASNPHPRRQRALRAFGRLLERVSPGHLARSASAAHIGALEVLARLENG